MPQLRPFEGYFVDRRRVGEVAAPAYDALTPQQRHQFASNHPDNYLNVMRSLEEFPPAERPTQEELLHANAAKLKRLLDDGAFVYDATPCLYLYRLASADHVQIGVVAEVSIDEYDSGHVKKHEHTQPQKEEDLTRYIEVVGANSSPVSLAYPQDERIDRLVAELTHGKPHLDFVAEDGLAQTIWRIEDEHAVRQLVGLFENVPVTYLTDGHHRSAAGSRFAAHCRDANPGHRGDEPYNFMLVALFPHDQLKILSYNRVVEDLNGNSATQFVAALEEQFDVQRIEAGCAERARPQRHGEMGMFLDGQWYRLTARSLPALRDDPVGALDVVILQRRVLAPILGIEDMRSDPRLDYVAGASGMKGLEAHCRQSGWRLGFACFPVSIEQLMAVADAGEVMPPKSTWFDPKVRSGIFLRLRS